MSENRFLKDLLKKRLDDAVEDIFEIFERTVAEYEEQIRRQRRILETVLSPTVSLQRTVLGPEHILQKTETKESAPYSPDICEALESADSEQTDHSSDYSPDQDQDYSPDRDQDLPPRPVTPDLGPEPVSKSLLTDHHSKEKPFSCPVCNQRFTKYFTFQQHRKICKKAIELPPEEKDYSCSVCNKTFRYLGKLELTNHLMTHFNATGKCLVCDKVISKQEQRRHMMIHSGEKPYSCSVCNKRFIKRYSCARHQATCRVQTGEQGSFSSDKNMTKKFIRRHTGESCKCHICGRSFMKKIALKNHLKICTKKTETPKPEEKNFTCSVCKETFAKNSTLTNHMTAHRDAETGKCLVCDVIIDKYHLRRHMMIHSGEEPISCPVCTKLFSRKTGLRKHLETCEKVLTEQGDFSCSVCNESFGNNLLLAVHMMAHAEEMERNLDGNDRQLQVIPQKTGQNLCSVCGKLFSSKTNLKKHMFIHSGVRPYSCTVCGQTFRQNFDRKRHMMLHTGEKPFSCKFCNKAFLRRVHMKKHMSVHVQNGTLSCEMLEQDVVICNNCGAGFNRDLHFRRHLEKCENDSAALTYRCSVCGQLFTEREELSSHLTTHKSGAKVNCAICGKTFPSVEMKHHLGSHSIERAYICEVCGKGFKRSNHLKGHLEIHKKDREEIQRKDRAETKTKRRIKRERTFECEICGKGFIRKYQLKLHLKTHRTVELAAVQGLESEQETYSCPDCAFPCESSSERQLHCPSCKRSWARSEPGLNQDWTRSEPGLNQDWARSEPALNQDWSRIEPGLEPGPEPGLNQD